MNLPSLSSLRAGEAAKLSRPYLWVLTAAPFAAGYLVAEERLSIVFWVGLVYFVFPYNLLFYGLAESQKYSTKWLSMWLVATNLPLLVWLLSFAEPAARLWLIAALFATLAYSLKPVRLKEIPLLDALSWAFVVSAPLSFGLLHHWQADWLPAVLALLAWAAASQTFETIQTLEQDRQAGLYTTATWLGARAATILSTTLYLVSVTLALVFYGGGGAAAAAVLALYAFNTARFLGVANPELFSIGWRSFLKLNYLAVLILGLLLAARSGQ